MEDNMKPGRRTSSYIGNGGGNCVEVGDAARVILVRDTKDRTGPVLRFTPAAWRGLAERVKRSLASGSSPGAWWRCRGVGAAVCWFPSVPGRREPAVISRQPLD
jgi:Domain of unknown function (DUF397)